MIPPEDIRLVIQRAGIGLADGQWALLSGYADALLEENSVVNLISRKDEENIWRSHLLHSLALTAAIPLPSSAKILDLGTGGGLPGIPLAIVRPDLTVHLVDSIQKKVRAVQSIVEKLGLSNVRVHAGRAEEMHIEKGEGYQVIVARAVAPLVDLLKWTTKLFDRRNRMTCLIEVEGKVEEFRTPFLVAMKGGELEEEISRARVRYPEVRPVVVRFKGIPPGSSLLDDKKIIVVPR